MWKVRTDRLLGVSASRPPAGGPVLPDVLEKILEAAYPGLERISVSLLVGVPEAVALEHLERFATEVRQAFKTTAAPAAVVD